METRRQYNSSNDALIEANLLWLKHGVNTDLRVRNESSSAAELPREFFELKMKEQEVKNCDCLVSRVLSRNKEILSSERSFKKKQRIATMKKLFSSTRLPKDKSLRFCFCMFLTWSLLIAPALNDILRHILTGPNRTLFGGVAIVQGCQPGRVTNGGSRARLSLNLTPFQLNEYVPKMSEQTIGASGPALGPIYRDTPKYEDELVANYNTDIEFRNEEQTNEDRMMTRLCKDRLDALASLVVIQWPGVKLRVTEAWDDLSGSKFPARERSLHYEGRAVDITTAPQDRSKYPILARLAVEAGFDWVLYKSSYVHCSVKSGSAGDGRSRGCFPGESKVSIPGGRSIRMDELRPGDSVYSVNSNGRIVPDTVLAFMDIRSDIFMERQASRHFVSISTITGHSLRLTRNHMVYTSKRQIKSSPSIHASSAIFAANVQKGDYIFIAENSTRSLSDATVRPAEVAKVEHIEATSGAYAPLTDGGTILVDGAMASCYAVFESDKLAHLALAPARAYHKVQIWISSFAAKRNSTKDRKFSEKEGIMPYANFLYIIANRFIPEPWFWGD